MSTSSYLSAYRCGLEQSRGEELNLGGLSDGGGFGMEDGTWGGTSTGILTTKTVKQKGKDHGTK